MDEIRYNLNEIVNRYLFELSSDNVMHQMMHDMSMYLNSTTYRHRVLNKTTPTDIDNGNIIMEITIIVDEFTMNDIIAFTITIGQVVEISFCKKSIPNFKF